MLLFNSNSENNHGGLKVTLFSHPQPAISEGFRNDFGTISERIVIEPAKNLDFIQSNYEAFMEYLRNNFGITSEKLRKSFGITSDRNLPNPINSLIIIVLFPEITAEEIGLILGVSGRSAETYIKKLKEKNLIERIGGNKEGIWQIKKQAQYEIH